jgi:MFS family permease
MSQVSGGADLRRWLALGLLGTAFFMVILDRTIVYVALTSIDAALGFSAEGLQWVMSAYLLTFGGSTPCWRSCELATSTDRGRCSHWLN